MSALRSETKVDDFIFARALCSEFAHFSAIVRECVDA